MESMASDGRAIMPTSCEVLGYQRQMLFEGEVVMLAYWPIIRDLYPEFATIWTLMFGAYNIAAKGHKSECPARPK